MLSTRFLLQFLPFVLSAAYSTKCHNSLCRCEEENTINCTNLGDNGLNLLKTLDIIQSPKLNYLIINGAHLGDLPNSNIFGTNVHQHLHTIHLINAGITSFGPNTFSGAPELSFLVLDGNHLRSVHPQSFKYMKSLKTISLNRVFDADRQNNQEILNNLFNVPLPNLRNVSLRGNELLVDVTSLLCGYPELSHLDLSDNRLNTFHLPPNCSAKIEELLLNDNDLVELPTFNFPVKRLTLYNNPLNCDLDVCKRQEVFKALQNVSSTFCAFPKNRSFDELISEEGFCESSPIIRNILICIGLILGAFLIAIRASGYCRNDFHTKVANYDMIRLSEGEEADPTFV